MGDTRTIHDLVELALQHVQSMIDVNTVIGEAVETKDGTVIIPVSRVMTCFFAGGGDLALNKASSSQRSLQQSPNQTQSQEQEPAPFSGGSGGGVSVQPVGFLVVRQEDVRMLPVSHQHGIESWLEHVPSLLKALLDAWQQGAGAAEAAPAQAHRNGKGYDKAASTSSRPAPWVKRFTPKS